MTGGQQVWLCDENPDPTGDDCGGQTLISGVSTSTAVNCDRPYIFGKGYQVRSHASWFTVGADLNVALFLVFRRASSLTIQICTWSRTSTIQMITRGPTIG